MIRTLQPRFWLEVCLASVTAGLALLTLAWHAWIEAAFGVDPDHQSGLVEWGLVVGLLAVTLFLAARARTEWRRAILAAA